MYLQVNGFCLNKSVLEDWLKRDPLMTPARISSLLNPVDKMNVASAVELLSVVVKECKLAQTRLVSRSGVIPESMLDLANAQRDAGLSLLLWVFGPLLSMVLPANRELPHHCRSIADQLKFQSASAHVTAFLFDDDADLMPSVLVHTLQANAVANYQIMGLFARHAAITNEPTLAPLSVVSSDVQEELHSQVSYDSESPGGFLNT